MRFNNEDIPFYSWPPKLERKLFMIFFISYFVIVNDFVC